MMEVVGVEKEEEARGFEEKPSEAAAGYDRSSHNDFLNQRDFSNIQHYWSYLLTQQSVEHHVVPLPSFIQGDEEYGMTDLKALQDVSVLSGEFASKDAKFQHRHTFVLSIGYNGNQYNGYQQQKGVEKVRTVEDDLEFLLHRKVSAAGRTDKEVSAMCQIISFTAYVEQEKTIDGEIINEESILQSALKIMRRHDLSINGGETEEDLPTDLAAPDNSQDHCDDVHTDEPPLKKKKKDKAKKPALQVSSPVGALSGKIRLWNCVRVSRKFHPLFSAIWRRYVYLFPLNVGQYSSKVINNVEEGEAMIDVDVDFVQRCLDHIEGKTLPFNGFAHRDNRDTGKGESDICTLYRLRTAVVNIDTAAAPSSSGGEDKKYALGIELVGNRFLRRMVRLLVATSIRESILPATERDEEVLLKICQSGNRHRAALAASGIGLALCGVGYDLEDLADFKNQNTKPSTNTTAKNDRNDDNAKSNEGRKEVEEPSGTSAEINLQSRRRKYHQKLLLQRQQQNGGELTKFENVSQSIAKHYQDSIQHIAPSSSGWLHEVIACDAMLLHYPERCFDFKLADIHILLPQHSGNIFSTIWDAEVVLAHHLEEHRTELFASKEGSLPIVMELGAGTALASILCLKLARCQAIVQEIDEEATQYALKCLQSNVSVEQYETDVHGIAGYWGSGCIEKTMAWLGSKKVDLMLMSDVFYHEEHFVDLLHTIDVLIQDNGTLIFAFEQRRKDLLNMMQQLLAMFGSHQIFRYSLPRQTSSDHDHHKNDEVADVFVVMCRNKLVK